MFQTAPFFYRRAAHGGWSCEFDENYPNALERSATNICFLLSLAVFLFEHLCSYILWQFN